MIPKRWHFYVQFFKGFKLPLVASVLGAVCAAGLLLVVPLLVRHAFDNIIPQQRYGELVFFVVLAIAVNVAYLGVNLWVRRTVFTISKQVTKTLRKDAIEKLYNFSLDLYSRLNRGGLHAKLVIDIDRIDGMTEALIGGLLPSLIIGILLIGGMLILSWPLLMVALIVFACFIPFTRSVGNRLAKVAQQYQRTVRKMSARWEFAISHFLLTKLKSAEQQELAAHDLMIKDVARTGLVLAMWRSAFSELQNFFAFTTAVVLLGVGVGATSLGLLTFGDVLAFYVMAMLFRGQYAVFSQAVTPVLEGALALSTIEEVLTLEDNPAYQGTQLIDFKGGIRFENVVFGYGAEHLLDGVSFELRPGEIVGIIGPNGSGKTTVAKLILGLHCPTSGEIFADNRPLADLDLSNYRHQIGVVMQDPMVFGGTVAENICYGDPKLNEAKMVAAAKIAAVDSLARDFPDGYETQIGDDGIMLSGGQKQKIAIARAIYDAPRLLILDEPTNHLDSVAIETILNSLTRLSQRPTVLIISHDIRVLERIRNVYRLENGTIQSITITNYYQSAN